MWLALVYYLFRMMCGVALISGMDCVCVFGVTMQETSEGDEEIPEGGERVAPVEDGEDGFADE